MCRVAFLRTKKTIKTELEKKVKMLELNYGYKKQTKESECTNENCKMAKNAVGIDQYRN
jgi:hypothetical protein